jgi:cold shock CspA family protein
VKYQKGTVRWFNNLRGEGFTRVGDESIYVTWRAIAKGFRANCSGERNSWFVLFPKQEVMVKVFRDYHWTQIEVVKGV